MWGGNQNNTHLNAAAAAAAIQAAAAAASTTSSDSTSNQQGISDTLHAQVSVAAASLEQQRRNLQLANSLMAQQRQQEELQHHVVQQAQQQQQLHNIANTVAAHRAAVTQQQLVAAAAAEAYNRDLTAAVAMRARNIIASAASAGDLSGTNGGGNATGTSGADLELAEFQSRLQSSRTGASLGRQDSESRACHSDDEDEDDEEYGSNDDENGDGNIDSTTQIEILEERCHTATETGSNMFMQPSPLQARKTKSGNVTSSFEHLDSSLTKQETKEKANSDGESNLSKEEEEEENLEQDALSDDIEGPVEPIASSRKDPQDNEKEEEPDQEPEPERQQDQPAPSAVRGKVLRQTATKESDDESDDDDDDDEIVDLATPAKSRTTSSTKAKSGKKSSESKSSSKTKTKSSTKKGNKRKTPSIEDNSSRKKKRAPSSSTTTPNKKTRATPNKRSSAKRKTPGAQDSSSAGAVSSSRNSPTSPSVASLISNNGIFPPLHTPVPKLTPTQYQNLDALMTQFCKVPLLAEFSRPISLLHPELTPLYSKVVQHPMDLGKVCRGIRKRKFENCRAVGIDMWRIFANCVKYHTHPLTKDGAIVSFISIAMHLRSFFNALWLEYMLPSEVPITSKKTHDLNKLANSNAAKKRDVARKERLNALNQTELSLKCHSTIADSIDAFVASGGRVDDLDVDPIDQVKAVSSCNAEEVAESIETVFSELRKLSEKHRDIVLEKEEAECTVDMFDRDIRRCVGHDIFEGLPALRLVFTKRLDRLMGKILVPLLEANARGGNQSSIWGCMAAVIWARESTKKPYWPALVLGIMAPDDQVEDWHKVVTKRNEARLPEKLRNELQVGKRKAEQAIRRQNNGNGERMSFFLVEFLGTHEFIWIREADIIENFHPEEDPNQKSSAGNITKKKKTSLRGQTPANERMRQKAIDEGRWAMQEFEMQLNDPCGDMSDEEEEEEEENYTYSVLCESDDEADEADGGLVVNNNLANAETLGSPNSKISDDIEEFHELISTDGVLDYSVEGRKNAKKRAAALKKQQADAKREALKKEKELKSKKAKAAKKAKDDAELKKKAQAKTKKTKEIEKEKRMSGLEQKREQKELEKRRKKRERERERFLKEEERKAKKMKSGDSSSVVKRGRKLGIADKRGRAASIIRGYLNRTAMKDNLKGLGLNGVLGIPTASVEASGLLGLTLAFRAAAGQIEMPNASDNPSVFRPWDRIDVDEDRKSEDRCKKLEKQIELIEKAMEKLDSDDLRRKELITKVKKEKEEKDLAIVKAETEARQNDMPKRKPFIKKKDSSPKPSDEKDGAAQEHEDKEEPTTAEDIPQDDEADEEEPRDTDSLECDEDI